MMKTNQQKNKVTTLTEVLAQTAYCSVIIEKAIINTTLSSYLESKYNIKNADFEIGVEHYDDVCDVIVEFNDATLNSKLINIDYDYQGRFLLADAIAHSIGLEGTDVSVFPEGGSVEYISVELPINSIIALKQLKK